MKLLILLFTSALLLAGCATTPTSTCERTQPHVASDAELQLAYLEAVPRNNREREDLVAAAFRSLGCTTSKDRVARRNAHNVICVIPGDTEREIWITAHHDSLGSGRGVADNWSGITVLLSLARHHLIESPQHTFRFVAFAEEERDLKGAVHMIQQIKNGNFPAPAAVINIDTLGIRELAYDAGSDTRLSCLARTVARSRSIELTSKRLADMSGDWLPFRQAGIPALHLHALDADAMKYLHTYRDKRDLVDDEKLKRAFTLIADLVASLDAADRDGVR